jgi:threonylcarbamoyladenosine tRNA methylthiotransferase MtaB
VGVATLGCKVNQCESAGIAAQLVNLGLRLVPFESVADCYIVNTCTVTAGTDAQSRQLIRRAIRRNPQAAVLVTGCYAQRAPQEIARISGVRVVAGNAEKAGLAVLLGPLAAADAAPEPLLRVSDIGRETEFVPLGTTVFPEHTRAFLKIQDGCNASCTYCIVPHARGRSRSLPPARVFEAVDALAAQGYREVVLTGIHLGAYGRDLSPAADLSGLVGGLAGRGAIDRLRLSSVEPREVTGGLLMTMAASPSICRHLHIPLQSGDDQILSAMKRDYDAAFFRELVGRATEAVPGIAIGVDVLAGFPGETEEAFLNTCRLIEALPVAYLHVFPYSRRPGTPAAALPDQVPEAEKKQRARRLRQIGTAKRRAFAEGFLGTPLQVLVEDRTDPDDGLATGFSDNYLPVAIRGGAIANRIVWAVPRTFRNGRLIAEVLHDYAGNQPVSGNNPS